VTPRRVELTLAELRGLTILERARACAVAGVAEHELAGMLRAVVGRQGTPAELERAVELLYAIALQLERRTDPAATWADAQLWDLALRLDESAADPIADAEAAASVAAARATGLPPAVAGELTLAQLEAYGAAERKPRTRRHARTRR